MATPTKWTSSRTILASSEITPVNFAEFGEVIENPASVPHASKHQSVTANQGSATKYLDITHIDNHYATLAPSRKPARAVMNMFVCKPRTLTTSTATGKKIFKVWILERHPFTPQTFVPLGIASSDPSTRYLVIVAPTLPATTRGPNDALEKPYPTDSPRRSTKSLKERLLGARPNPFTNDHAPTTTPAVADMTSERKPKGPGGPDLANLQAFLVRGDQAVTYGPGTWHAPMVVLGDKDVPFVVVQYANGVGLEDCQETGIGAIDGGEGVVVDVGEMQESQSSGESANGAGIMRAKL
jgi:ureidoglycolate lyase